MLRVRRNEVRKRTGLTLGEYVLRHSGTSNPSAGPRTWLCRLSQQKKSARSCLPIQVQPSSTAQLCRNLMLHKCRKVFSYCSPSVYACVWVCGCMRVCCVRLGIARLGGNAKHFPTCERLPRVQNMAQEHHAPQWPASSIPIPCYPWFLKLEMQHEHPWNPDQAGGKCTFGLGGP